MDVIKAAAELKRMLAVQPGDAQLWKDYLEAELQDAYKLLANLSTNQEDTCHIRGRVTFINKLLGYINRPTNP